MEQAAAGGWVRPVPAMAVMTSAGTRASLTGCGRVSDVTAAAGGHLGEEGDVLGVSEVVDEDGDDAGDDVRAQHQARLRERRGRSREEEGGEGPVRAEEDGVVSVVAGRPAGPGGVGDPEEADEGADESHGHALDVHAGRRLALSALPLAPVLGEEALDPLVIPLGGLGGQARESLLLLQNADPRPGLLALGSFYLVCVVVEALDALEVGPHQADHGGAVRHASDHVRVSLLVQIPARYLRVLLELPLLAWRSLVGQIEHEDAHEPLGVGRVEDRDSEKGEEEFRCQLCQPVLGRLRVLQHLAEDVPVLVPLAPNHARQRLTAAEARVPPHPLQLHQHAFRIAETAGGVAGPGVTRGVVGEAYAGEAAQVRSLGLVMEQVHGCMSVVSMRVSVVKVSVLAPVTHRV
eukprot:766209-Hanusia_phi.AAC.1